MKRIISILTAAVTLMSFTVFSHSEGSGNELRFKDGKFKILVLSDTQDDHHPAADMLNLVEQAIKEASPDLIVFTGDLVEDSRAGDIGIDDEPFREGVLVEKDGEVDKEKTFENVSAAAKAVLDIFDASGVPFAIVQGNNDYKVAVSNEEWLALYSEYSNSLAFDESDDAEGRIDYHLEIKGSDGSDKFNLWIMDTGRNGMKDDQIEWYKKKSSEITEANGGEVVPAIEFQHIQPADVGNLFVECSPFDEGARAKGLKFYRLNPETAAGYNFFAYAPCEPTPLFKAWKEQGDVIGSYFGHQHIEGFTGTYDGIEMGFNYGSEMAKPGPYGYRLITLDENDVTNYENEIFTYEGSVKTGNAHFEKQIDTPYKDLGNLKYILGIGNFFWSMITVLIDLFV
ncbi:MAG: metallophosphoesterase [Clostridia bacterium]|nr:metallophosphoesterase [Clostridia bacterium]